MIDGQKGALSGIVQRAIATGFRDANIFNSAVTIDGEGESGFGVASGADGWVDGVLHPVLIDGATNGFDVPAIACGKITTTLALNGNTTIERARLIGIASGNVHLAALTVRDSVRRRGSFIFEDLGFFAGRKRFFFFKFGDVGGVLGWLGRFGLRLFDVETFGGVDDLGISGVDGGRHGNAGAGDEIYFYAGVTTADAAPGIAGALQPNTDKENDSERDVKKDGIREVPFEVEIVGDGGVGHGAVNGQQLAVSQLNRDLAFRRLRSKSRDAGMGAPSNLEKVVICCGR